MDWKMRRNVLTIVTIVLTLQSATGSYVTLTENGFDDVVVVIEEYNNNGLNCQADLEFVKGLIQKTSDSFGSALPDTTTRFGNVTIIVPDSWSSDCGTGVITNDVVQPWARNRLADFRITQNHPVFSWYPYSFQYYPGCNQPGLPINIPFTFNNGSDNEQGRRLAREWAHYRYGVFDEGGVRGDPMHPSGYMTFEVEKTAKVSRPNVCSHKLAVKGDWNKESCSNEIDSECEFVPDINQNNKILSSLMYRPDFKEISLFCDEKTHDDGVPSKQNYYCNGLSATEVINQHPDFTSNVEVSDPKADIIFNVISNPFKGYHIILDISSFDIKTFEDVKRSLVNFITFLPNALYLTVGVFNSTDVYDLLPTFDNQTALNDDMRRNMISALIDLQVQSDGNAISGLRKALDQSISRVDNGQDVIILTAIRSATGLSAQFDLYKTKRVNAHLFDYFQLTRNPDDDLAKLTSFGSYRWIPTKTNTINGTSVGTYAVVTGALHSIYSETKTKREKIYERVSNLTVNAGLRSNIDTGSFFLDGQASSIYLALYFANGVTPISWTVTPPNGNPIELNSETTSRPKTTFLWLATFNSTVNVGEWKYTMTFALDETYVLTEMSVWADSIPSQLLPDSQQAPMVELKTWNSAAADPSQIWDPRLKPMGLYAQVTHGRRPVHNVSAVYAYVYTLDLTGEITSLLTTIPLLDDGIADVTSGDGIYSGYLTTISNASLIYSVRYEIRNNGTAQIDTGTYGYPPTTGSSIPITSSQPVFSKFYRADYGSSFRLTTTLMDNYDFIPPQRITDFSITEYDGTTATLQWTAPRDNFGSGDVITKFLLESAVGSDPWKSDQVSIPILQKDGEQSIMKHTVEVPNNVPAGGYVKFRLIGVDSADNQAAPSNTATVAGPPNPWPPGDVNTALMWGLIGAGIFLLILIIILVACCCLYPVQAKRKKRAATKKMKEMFSTDKNKKKKESSKNNVVASSNVYAAGGSTQQPWNSPNIKDVEIHEADDGNYYSDDRRRMEDQHNQRSAALTGSQMIYFGDQHAVVTGEDRDGGYSDYRGVEEMIKRAPSMDLQLATILMKNSSNLSIDQVGLDDDQKGKNKPVETMNTTVFARPFSKHETPAPRNPAYNKRYSERPISQSQSDTNLYYTDVNLIPPLSRQPGRAASPTNSYFSLYADQQQRTSSNPRNSNGAQMMDDPISKLAATMRAGLRGEEWQDSNSFVYSDPRYDADQPKSTFEPHPANRVGLPPPPTQSEMYGNTRSSTHSLNHLQYGTEEMPEEEQEEEEEEVVLRRGATGGSKPSLVSAV